MAKTINFCGDSFCVSDHENSWTNILTNLLGYSTFGRGKNGSAHEHAIQSFNPNADITVFCWTEPHRLYHSNYAINMNACDSHRKEIPIYEAAYQFYKQIHELQYFNDRQKRDLYWFDHEVLSKYIGTIIHLWNFNKTYNFIHGLTVKGCLINLSSTHKENTKILNHLSFEQNKLLADKLYKLLRNENG